MYQHEFRGVEQRISCDVFCVETVTDESFFCRTARSPQTTCEDFYWKQFISVAEYRPAEITAVRIQVLSITDNDGLSPPLENKRGFKFEFSYLKHWPRFTHRRFALRLNNAYRS
jgi:hypothetical protein